MTAAVPFLKPALLPALLYPRLSIGDNKRATLPVPCRHQPFTSIPAGRPRRDASRRVLLSSGTHGYRSPTDTRALPHCICCPSFLLNNPAGSLAVVTRADETTRLPILLVPRAATPLALFLLQCGHV
jgi:hypothetical protein